MKIKWFLSMIWISSDLSKLRKSQEQTMEFEVNFGLN